MMQDKSVLILASVASMIDQFNMPNIKLLVDMGFNVHVACNFTEGNNCSKERISLLKNDLSNLGVEYYQIDFKRNVLRILDNVKAYKQVLNLMKKNKYRFIHCHSPIGGLCGRIAGKATDIRVIYTAHGFHFYKGAPLINWIIYYPIEKWLSKHTDVLITINREDYTLAQKSFNAGRTEYLPGVGLDIDKINRIKVDKKIKRRELGLPENCSVLLSVGELNRNKNHEVTIRALSITNDVDVHYVICGQGPLAKYLKSLSESLGIGEQVHLLGYRNDIIEITKSCDIFVFPSLREGLGMAALEAMASGLPIVTSDVRGIIDYSIDGITGFICDPRDHRAFRDAIIKLLSDKALCCKIGQNNIEEVKKFDINEIMNKISSVYSQII